MSKQGNGGKWTLLEYSIDPFGRVEGIIQRNPMQLIRVRARMTSTAGMHLFSISFIGAYMPRDTELAEGLVFLRREMNKIIELDAKAFELKA